MVPNYGEGKTHAVRRLRKEIESQNEAWVYQKGNALHLRIILN